MIVYDPGHQYGLNRLDGGGLALLQFVKREGPNFPGNKGTYPGTNLQEVLRALIDRVKYLDKQIPHYTNTQVLYNLRDSLNLLEIRAAERHQVVYPFPDYEGIENINACNKCGHLVCGEHCK